VLTDGDGDGLPALIEYALGSDPAESDASNPIILSSLGGRWQASYRRARTADGVTVIAEYSSDLTTWERGTIVGIANAGAGIDLVTTRFTGGGGARQYVRLRVGAKN
jgi:hypothetical protein